MVEGTARITNESGIHARPAGQLVKLVRSFKSDVYIDTGDKEVKCNSIVNLLMAAVKPGATVKVRAEGEDEGEALLAIVSFLEGLALAEGAVE
jgi:phosphotransferase system HPr (HPr) family protein